MASSRSLPQNSGSAMKAAHTAGLSSLPQIAHSYSSVRWIHLTPAGFPDGIPGMGDDIEGAMQHAPHPLLHFILKIIKN